MLNPERKAEIIRLLAEFLEKKLGCYDIPDLIYGTKEGDVIFIRGSANRKLPDEFMTALGITENTELFEALKSVVHNPGIGEFETFSATFRFPAHEGGAA